jgi:hypothetical protein
VFVSGVLLVSGVPVEVVVEGLAAFEGLAVVEDIGVDMDEVEDKDVNTIVLWLQTLVTMQQQTTPHLR